MARRQSSSRPQGRRATQSPSMFASPRLHPLPLMVSRPFVGYDALRGKPRVTKASLRAVQDRRTWFPSIFRPAASLGRRADTKLVVSPIRSIRPVSRLPVKVAFAVPRRVLICVRRKVRKEVLLATGKGGGGKAKPRHNQFSDVRC